jgi:hypothetical protein
MNLHESQSHITTDSRSASPSWCQAPIWDPRPVFLSLGIFFRQLQVCYFVAPSLTRGRVCNLLLLLVLASVFPLGSESRGTQAHILLSKFLRLPQPGRPGPVFISPRNRVAQIYPRALGLDLHRSGQLHFYYDVKILCQLTPVLTIDGTTAFAREQLSENTLFYRHRENTQ